MSEYMSAAEKRFYSVTRRIRNTKLNKEQQIEVSYLIDDILKYGFKFFPNHYLWEKLEHIENYAVEIAA